MVANGGSLAPAQSLALRFLAAGVGCEAPSDIVSQHITAKLLSAGDVCIAVSTADSPEIERAQSAVFEEVLHMVENPE
ncbi:transcriptional regulator, RpiR family protein [Arthrobacter sp. Hiyo8]|uniref:hypothetical protein n=1 Tax=Arthrobacter sp. Hiyo1 TaxID=1588020 RepID=UPI0006839CA3|nr:hypothetical protein [Arthrobacter sp. Hiyo1]BAS15952.1 transcriptional regulator, RpiR family protein [Arthrobacter sp. Hiyo8]GAP60337.1 transcriptional regulator, RpiR family protein [Arthrobacter sp. Hiyo1]